MGTLGRYLQEAREARGFDLRAAAQQTRISMQYLKALEAEDFSKLPGEVFVKGFLKSYAKFLHLDESDVMMRYGELEWKQSPSALPVPAEPSESPDEQVRTPSAKIPIEPFFWGAGIIVVLVLFLFMAFPKQQPTETRRDAAPAQAGQTELASAPVPTATAEKLYLEVVALENTWLLVRTDASPQKKAVLNAGESLIWSADERFLLSYSSAGAVKLLLNGQELIVNEPKDAAIRDLAITASGIVDRTIPNERPRPAKPKMDPAVQAPPAPQNHPSRQAADSHQAEPAPQPQQPAPAPQPQQPAPAPQPQQPAPAPQPQQPAPAPQPQQSVPATQGNFWEPPYH